MMTKAIANRSIAAIITAILLSTHPSTAPSLPSTRAIMIDGASLTSSSSPRLASSNSADHRAMTTTTQPPAPLMPPHSPLLLLSVLAPSQHRHYPVFLLHHHCNLRPAPASSTPAQTSSPCPQVRSAACITNAGTICTSQSSTAWCSTALSSVLSSTDTGDPLLAVSTLLPCQQHQPALRIETVPKIQQSSSA